MNKINHYRRFLSLLVLLSATTFGLAGFAQQVMLADSITQNPVCYATVYDANGTVIGRSDMGGYIHLQKGFEYHISHISYEPKSFVYNDDSIIFLSPSFYTISEVSVTAKKRKYYHCKVYFRSIEHVDSCLKYYMDGIRESFIDTKSKNISEIHNEKDSFLLIFDNMTFHNRCYKVIAPVTFPHSAYYIIGRKDYLAVPDKSPFEIHKKVRIQLNNS